MSDDEALTRRDDVREAEIRDHAEWRAKNWPHTESYDQFLLRRLDEARGHLENSREGQNQASSLLLACIKERERSDGRLRAALTALDEARAANAILQADAANDVGYRDSLHQSITQLCEAIGIERGGEDWGLWITNVRAEIGGLRANGNADQVRAHLVAVVDARDAEIARLREERDARHPWYGPCDGLAPNGECAECLKLRAPPDDAMEIAARAYGFLTMPDPVTLSPREMEIIEGCARALEQHAAHAREQAIEQVDALVRDVRETRSASRDPREWAMACNEIQVRVHALSSQPPQSEIARFVSERADAPVAAVMQLDTPQNRAIGIVAEVLLGNWLMAETVVRRLLDARLLASGDAVGAGTASSGGGVAETAPTRPATPAGDL